MKEIILTDIVSVTVLQSLQDSFAKANGVASTIVDLAGKNITEPSNHTKVCLLIRQTKKGLDNCMISGANLGTIAHETKKPYYAPCKSIGFMDAAAPILVDDVHVANWLIGQRCVADVDENRIISYAKEIGIDEQELLNAFREIDHIPEADFVEMLDFLSVMANQLSMLAYQNKINMDLVESLTETKDELENYKNNLEELVQERTSEVVTLSGLLPICMHCKGIRDDKGYWKKLEIYISEHSKAEFSHGICEPCLEKYYPEDSEEDL